MPTVEVTICSIIGASEADLNQWCSHHLINRFQVFADYLPDPENAGRRGEACVNIRIIGHKDRLRLRAAYDIARTQFFREIVADPVFDC